MKGLIFLLAFLGISHFVLGAQKIDVQERVRRSLNDGSSRRHPRSVQRDPDDLLGLDRNEHLKPQETMVTAQNTVKIKYSEEYKGLPVIGEAIVLEQTPDGRFTNDASGSLLEQIAHDVPSIDPVLSADDAFNIALHIVDLNPEHVMFRPDRDIFLAIYTINVHRRTDDDQLTRVKAVLVYQVTITSFNPSSPVEMQIMIDANTGKVLHKSNLLESFALKRKRRMERVMEIQSVGGNEKTGAYTYGKDWPSLKVATEDGVMCRFENEHVIVLHLNFSDDEPELDSNLTGYAFECKKGFNDTFNGAYSPLSDAYFFFSVAFDMFHDWYKSKPLKHQNTMVVHTSEVGSNAKYYSGVNLLAIGDGGKELYPLSSIGIVTHEVCHGYTGEHSDLEYSGQSGGINEAFSDMASEAAQAYLTSKSDWMIGYEVVKAPNGSLRWMKNPGLDNASISTLQDYCPGMEVHYSSGVFNKAFYLLANRPGWNIRKAFHVFLMANTLYWRKNSDFADGACGAVKAAKDLGFPAEDVKSVFLDVDIMPCVERRYNFQNLIDIYVSPKNKFKKYFDTSGINSKKITLEIWLHEEDLENAEPDDEAEYDLSVTFNGRKVLCLHSSKSESVDIPDVQPGRYHITIEGEVPKLSVYVVADQIFHESIDIIGTNHTTVFNLSVTDVHPSLGMVVRASGPREIAKFSTFSYQGGYEGRKIKEKLFETLYCNPMPGPVMIDLTVEEKSENMTVKAEENETFSISAYHVYNLYPRTNF